ncbi:hypothetical protein BpHYR1_020648 [Brachionus plicatilis]|uniref:Uncharacterized protein n=1 Tax=Brachionus plicatilis TaxID=10195 RepID=A0A3M7QBN3_BRAPC|nr:hypothetical protein BpHYR1_020648 [Brachionus plicatilis]
MGLARLNERRVRRDLIEMYKLFDLIRDLVNRSEKKSSSVALRENIIRIVSLLHDFAAAVSSRHAFFSNRNAELEYAARKCGKI